MPPHDATHPASADDPQDRAAWYSFRYLYERRDVDAYLYGNQGPWPQPFPAYPTALIPQVLHLPPGEQKLWSRKVGLTYLWEMLTRWPQGLWYAWRHPHQAEIDDEQFAYLLGEGLYSKFLTELDPEDEAIFEDHIHPGPTWRKIDGRHMQDLVGQTNPGVYVAPTVTLLRREGDNPIRAVAIHLPHSQLTLTPKDTDRHAWNLARYFVLQGAAHRINLVDHPLMHFPSDSVNAISKTILPKDHWLLKLLLPHLYLSLGVNHAVLEGDGSIVNRTKWVLYSPFAAPGGVVRGLLTYAFLGGNPDVNPKGFPRYRFQLEPRPPESQFQAFAYAYYEVILAFVREVVTYCIDKDRALDGNPNIATLGLWADYVAAWLPGFPNGEQLTNSTDDLAKTVAMVIWTVSAAHATDHETLHSMPPHTVPFRIRVPPPADAHGREFHVRDLNRWFDVLQAWFADTLFYKPHNHALLQDVDYAFDDPKLQDMNRRFRAALVAKDNELREDGRIRVFSPLDQMSASIQY